MPNKWLTVAEFIEALQRLPPDLVVFRWGKFGYAALRDVGDVDYRFAKNNDEDIISLEDVCDPLPDHSPDMDYDRW